MNQYKSALDKITLRQSEKDKAKALFSAVQEERKNDMSIKRLWKPAVILAAGLALVIAADAIIPAMQRGEGNGSKHMVTETVNNYFAVTAYAKELTRTGKVYFEDYASLGGAFDTGADNRGISAALEFPIECRGENIETITYAIREGAFCISNPPGESVVVEGEKLTKKLDVPYRSMEDERNDVLTYQMEQYHSFTVRYDHQMTDQTCIDVVNTLDVWSKEKKKEFRDKGWDMFDCSLDQEKEIYDFLTRDLGITCTVTYKDGSTETKNIVISNEVVRLSEVMKETLPPEKDIERVIPCYRIS